ncbi:MAG: hypothetical protein ACM309_02695 [Bacillota bacterium]
MLTLIRRRRPMPEGAWETCEICHLGCRSREAREVEHEGRRVKACPACRARILQEKLRRERQKETGGQLMW